MKNKIKYASIVFCLSVLIMLVSCQKQKTEWKGAIEEENGVTVVMNPKEPLYGEIEFELEEDLSIGSEEDENYLFYRAWHMAVDKKGNIYVVDRGNTRIQVFDKEGQYFRTIGRKGQGPGEFRSPAGVFLNDLNGEIYVPDMRSIKVFASNGDYLRTISLKSGMLSYCISSRGIILSTTFKRQEKKYLVSLNFINSTGEPEATIATYPDQISKLIEGTVAKFIHGYEYLLFTNAIGPQTFVYGYSSNYELNIIDSTGKILFKIQKESPLLPISKKEKDAVREEFRDSPIKNVNNIPFPEHKPHYGRILSDGDWIFVMQYKSPQDQREVWPVDVFDKQGYYMYKSTLPVQPQIIKNGFVYLIDSSDESGNVRVKRYAIKNWEQIKEKIQSKKD
jgi:hypothetical protein